MAEQFKIIPGLVTIRQTGGTVGVDEIQLSHDGSNALIESKSGNVTLQQGAGKSLTINGTAVVPNAAGSLFIGSLSTYFSGLYSLSVTSPQDLDLTASNGTSAGGYGVNVTAGAADTGSDGNGGIITLTAGALDGTGANGYVIVDGPGLLKATTLEAPTVNRGSAGNAFLFTDAGANSITVGGSTSTIVVAGNLQVDGTTTTVNSATLDVTDKNITVNVGGTTAGATVSGIDIEGDSGAVVGYLRSASDNSNLEFKAPTGSILTLDMNSNASLTMSANLTVSGTSSINQNVTTTGTPTFNTLTINGTTENTISQSLKIGAPTAGSYTGAAGEINAEAIYINGTAVSAGSGVTQLDDLSDVVITGVASGNILYYDGTNFVNAGPGATSGVQPYDADLTTIAGLTHTSGNVIRSNGTVWQSTTLSFNDLGDVVITTPATNNLIRYNGTNWVNIAGLASNDLTDIEITGVAAGDILYYDGTNFVNSPPNIISGVQPFSGYLNAIAGLTPNDGAFIVGDGSTWTAESGNTARTSLGLGTGDSPTFVTVNGSTSVVTPTVQTPTLTSGTANTALVFTNPAISTITVGNSTSTTVIDGNLTVNGTTTTINSATLSVTDKNIVVNKGGTTAAATLSGIDIQGDSSAIVGYLRSASDNSNLEFKAPTGSILTIDMNTDQTIALDIAAVNDVIYFDGFNFVNGALNINSLDGIVITGATSGDILYYDGTNFVNDAPGATSGVQPYDADLTTIAGLTAGDGNFIVGDGTNWTTESGATARTSLGLGTNDTPQFTGLVLGDSGTQSTNRQYVVSNTTTDDTATELFIDGTAGTARLTVANDTTWCFDIMVVARRTDANDESARYRFEGAIDRNTGAGTIALVGDNEISITEDTTAWNVTVDADTTNGSLRITVTGQTSKTIKWVAFVNTVQVTG